MAKILRLTGAFDTVDYGVNMDNAITFHGEILEKTDGTKEEYTFIQMRDNRWIKVKESVDEILSRL